MPNKAHCNAKLYHKINSDEDCQKIQEDLNRQQSLAKKWQLRFNPQKCIVLSLGRNHYDYEYHMVSGGPDYEQDLGVLSDRGLTFQDHTNRIVKQQITNRTNYVDKSICDTV